MVNLTELVLRDGHQSLLATRLRTDDILPICEKLDTIGYFAAEIWGGATFDVPMRFLNEDPWDRLKKISDRMRNTPLQMLERAMNIVGYRHYPRDIVEKFIYYAHKNGIKVFRIFDALNDPWNMEIPIKKVREIGAHAQGCISYTISPVHTDEFYIDLFLEFQKMGCNSLCIKDMAGMISPKRAYNIIKGAKDAGVKIPIDLHSHSTSGMTGMAYMEACRAGVDVLDTSISPICEGTGHPSTESVVAALKDTEYDTGYSLKDLMECREYFLKVWEKYRHLHRMIAVKIDPSVIVHQIPGGMLSNFIAQLEQQGALDKYNEVLKETPRVREDFGYPPLVTPTSQIVGVQAVLNVLFGRYKRVPQETKDYIRGMYGRPPGKIKKEIYEKVLGPNWKEQLIEGKPYEQLENEFDKRKSELKEMGIYRKEEDVLTYALYPNVAIKFFKNEIKPEFRSEELPLPVEHSLSIEMLSSIFPEIGREGFKNIFKGKRRVLGVRSYVVEVDGVSYNVTVRASDLEIKNIETGEKMLKPTSTSNGKKTVGGKGKIIKSPMRGTILKLNVKQGQSVKKGDVVAILEAMKMENEVASPYAGTVESIAVKEGQNVDAEDVIMYIL